jgi:ribosomal protein S18 acetylase RimI-like enzyme
MTLITYVERDLTEKDLEHIWAGFREHEIQHTKVHQTSERIGFVALNGKNVVGCSIGLVYKNGENYSGWFYLTDLFIEPKYRGHGYGRMVLKKLEEKLIILGVEKIWLWTADFEAPNFYRKRGYLKFAELKEYYVTGDSRIAMYKPL